MLLADSYNATPLWGCGRDRRAPLAEAHYREAVRHDPRLALAYVNLANHLSWNGELEKALDAATQAVTLSPPNAPFRDRRAWILLQMGRSAEAEGDLHLLPDTANARIFRGWLALHRGDRAKGQEAIASGVRMMPTTYTELTVAVAYFQSGLISPGVAHLERALQQDRRCAPFIASSPAFAASRRHAEVAALLQRYTRGSPPAD